MNAMFSPFSGKGSRVSPRDSRAKPAKLKDPFAETIESAKNYLSTRLALATMLSFNEKVLVQRLGESILEGDIERMQRAMLELDERGSRREAIIAVVAGELRTPGVVFLPLQIARWRFSDNDELHEVAVFSIHLVNARRIFSIASDDRFGAHVYGRDGGITEELNEDPRILLKQIGRLITGGLTASPPPFSATAPTS